VQAQVEAPQHTPKTRIGRITSRNMHELKALQLITAIKTPYLADGRIDLEAYDALVEQQIAGDADGLIVGGTTGEGHLMSWDEHIMLIAHTAKHFGDRIAVIGNTGSNNTREAVHATCQGFAVGMDAALQINPYYGKTSTDGIRRHFEAVLDYGPTILYNVPGRTGQDIPDSVVDQLSAEHPTFAGVKECTGLDRIERHASRGISIWSGNDDDCHDARQYRGAQGVVSVTSNASPALVKHMMASNGPDTTTRDGIMPLMEWVFAQPNPIGINTLMSMMRMNHPYFRLPYLPFTKEDRQRGKTIVEELGLEHTVSDRIDVLNDEDFIAIV
jgi:4-hydroxy-tetrahydrodipicolinate synthase